MNTNIFSMSLGLFLIIFVQKCLSIPITHNLPAATEEQHIPKIFHNVWFNFGKGDKVLPKYEKNMDRLKELHPDWEFKLWNEQAVGELIKEHFPEFYKTWSTYDKIIKKHDSARLIVLYVFGGVYLDHDFVPLRNLEPMLKEYSFVIASERNGEFIPANGFMGSTKNNKILKVITDEMNKVGGLQVFDSTGYRILARVINKYAWDNKDEKVKVYGGEFFYPIPWQQRHQLSQLQKFTTEELKARYPSTFMIQEYDIGWQ